MAYVNMETSQIITLAPDFATFVQGLTEEEELVSLEEDLAYQIQIVEEGAFSPLLAKFAEIAVFRRQNSGCVPPPDKL